ncbi:lasso RiPP family leader peptide-containing protein [Micromonospora sp. NBC_01638]|uniref:lasso RiPP family leader peptide-containing protein n=1 Tax=Micromonospora sp. NBC_01638 TaxID=2975982 RepID=UPI003867A08F|nr:lasso RiPP family leader peptide-containing protein [Micromonospora sp. NBC_01638]
MNVSPVSLSLNEASQGYQPPQLRRLGTLAELTQGGFPGVTDADGQSGVEGSI